MKPKDVYYKYGDRKYYSAATVCAARAADNAKEDVGSPYDKVVQAKDGDPYYCEFVDKNGYKSGQHFGDHETDCPENATVHPSDPFRCQCDTNFVPQGGRCVPTKFDDDDEPRRAGIERATENPRDPCLNQSTKAADPVPDAARCPLSSRAWVIKTEFYKQIQNPKFWDAIWLEEKVAIAVSRGIVRGKQVTLVTTNSLKLYEKLKNASSFRRLPGERLGDPPKRGEHAEDVAERMFASMGVDRKKKVEMGSDPAACASRCTLKYRRHPWMVHERPTLP